MIVSPNGCSFKQIYLIAAGLGPVAPSERMVTFFIIYLSPKGYQSTKSFQNSGACSSIQRLTTQSKESDDPNEVAHSPTEICGCLPPRVNYRFNGSSLVQSQMEAGWGALEAGVTTFATLRLPP